MVRQFCFGRQGVDVTHTFDVVVHACGRTVRPGKRQDCHYCAAIESPLGKAVRIARGIPFPPSEPVRFASDAAEEHK